MDSIFTWIFFYINFNNLKDELYISQLSVVLSQSLKNLLADPKLIEIVLFEI